jgi:adenine-specific DNA-methyltransferase
VANTAGTYYAYLKQLSRKANLPMRLTLPSTTKKGSNGGCHYADAVDVVATVDTDILYLDPPYNQRDYAGYYHLPETLARGDTPIARGRSGTPAPRVARSDFYRSTRAAGALARIVAKTRARHIVVHYTTEGMIPHNTIIESLRARGSVRFEDQPVRAYSSSQQAGRREVRHRLYWCDVMETT